jgi:HD-like signal output (HDOD) protein
MNRSKESSFLLAYYPGTLQDLPILSPIAIKAAQAVRVRELTAGELSDAIKSDAFLSAKLVSVANSIYFNSSHTPCYTIDAALARVGLQFANALLKNSEAIVNPAERQGASRLWFHSVATATIAKDLSGLAENSPLPTEAVYWVAMIHDIGILVEGNFERQSLADVTSSYREHETHQDEHCILGHSLAHYWSLPQIAKDVLRWHHSYKVCPTRDALRLSAILALAHFVVEKDSNLEYGATTDVLADAGIKSGEFERMAKRAPALLTRLHDNLASLAID